MNSYTLHCKQISLDEAKKLYSSNIFKYAATPTLEPTQNWLEDSEDDRRKTIVGFLYTWDFLTEVRVISAHDDGQVILSLRQACSASERGTLLLDIEEMLKDKYDRGITVWLEPLGDKNSLRNLRGVEIK